MRVGLNEIVNIMVHWCVLRECLRTCGISVVLYGGRGNGVLPACLVS